MTSPYRRIDDAHVERTIETLGLRIGERFPHSGLSKVCAELLALSHETRRTVEYIRQPIWWVRICVGAAIALLLAAIVLVALNVDVPVGATGLAEFAQGIEASINNIVFVGVAIFFLVRIEGRMKRHRALDALHELRSVVHIVDMHQLTKDPERLIADRKDTPSSPERTMSAAELGRYLDYCSEMLSLASKLAALHVQYFNDTVVLSAVNEIETLSSSLSAKIWQKITLLEPLHTGLRAPR